jgi:antirestriction protein
MLNIFVNTWGNYNENGADGGKWVTLPMDPDALEEELETIAAAMGDTDPEWAVHDYEWTTDIDLFDVSEHDNITELNERLQELESLEEWELEEVAAAMEAFGYDFLEAVDRQQRGYFTLYRNMELIEVAEEFVNECYFTKDTPDIFTRYFDYEAFARDLRFDGYTETKYGVIIDG